MNDAAAPLSDERLANVQKCAEHIGAEPSHTWDNEIVLDLLATIAARDVTIAELRANVGEPVSAEELQNCMDDIRSDDADTFSYAAHIVKQFAGRRISHE